MVSVDRVPLSVAGYYAPDIRRVVPIPGLTGSPSGLVVLTIEDHLDFWRVICVSSPWLHIWLAGAVIFVTGHDRPSNSCRLVGHRDSDQLGWLSLQQTHDRGMVIWIAADRLKLRCHPAHQQTSEVLVTHLGDVPHALLTAAEICSRCQPQ